MSADRPTSLLVGPPERNPTVHFELTQMAGGVAIEASHSEGNSCQTVAEIGWNEEGFLELRIRDIHCKHLARLMGITPGLGMLTRFVDKSRR